MMEPQEQIDALADQVSRLEHRLAMAGRVQLLLILALVAFVWRAALLQHRGLEAAQANVPQIHKDIAQHMAILTELKNYAVTHPEFAKILRKHGIEPVAPTSTPAPQLPPGR